MSCQHECVVEWWIFFFFFFRDDENDEKVNQRFQSVSEWVSKLSNDGDGWVVLGLVTMEEGDDDECWLLREQKRKNNNK